MKPTVPLLFLIILFAACGETNTADSNTRISDEEALGNGYSGSKWYSREIQYSWNKEPNNIILTFSADSVSFDLPGGDGYLASVLLKKGGTTSPKHYSWPYSIDKKEIVLDPGLFGNSIHLEISGDSLIWKGGVPPGCGQISLKKTGPVVRLK